MASFRDKLQSMQDVNKGKSAEQEKYDSLIGSARAIDAIGLAAPMGVGAALKGIRDMQIAGMEKENPDLAPLNPYTKAARNRFTSVGQVLFGYGYPTTVQTPNIWNRAANVITGGNDIPHAPMGFYNARGQFLTTGAAPVTSGGWESGGGDGGGDGPAAGRGTTNFGGRESSISDNDYSGYA